MGVTDRKRGHAIQVRVSATEKEAFALAAEALGLSLSAWLRMLAAQSINGAMAPLKT
jgi:antitoxin component of RelBE/YafQ-DinJ toxin-antitoxin module